MVPGPSGAGTTRHRSRPAPPRPTKRKHRRRAAETGTSNGEGKGLKVVVIYLDMTARPRRPTVAAPLRKLAVLSAEKPTLSFYRYLYETIGRPWQWVDRSHLGDDDLITIVHDPKVEIYTLYVAGVPTGFAELDFRNTPRVDITHLGLMPEFAGQGLGRFLLNRSVDAA